MTTSTQWQLAQAAAERYQEILTPAILGPFARALVDHAGLQPDESVVDVGCGTGAATRYAAAKIDRSGCVIGVDVNEGMLTVARSLPSPQGSAIEWREASATRLPLPDGSMDVVLCAQTLQFLPDKVASLTEMKRVVKPDGRIALSLWSPLAENDNPYFNALVTAVARHIGPDTAVGLRSAFALTDAEEIRGLLQEAGLASVEMTVTRLDLPFPDLAAFIPRHISATPMGAGFSRAAATKQQAVIDEVVARMAVFGENGRVRIPFRSHMILITP